VVKTAVLLWRWLEFVLEACILQESQRLDLHELVQAVVLCRCSMVGCTSAVVTFKQPQVYLPLEGSFKKNEICVVELVCA
jgi:hypothetical protein